MKYYQAKSETIKGGNYRTVYRQAWYSFVEIKSRTKRRPYLRSVYFDKEKIFFDYFWEHLKQKSQKDKMRRLAMFDAAIEVIEYSYLKPFTEINRNNKN